MPANISMRVINLEVDHITANTGSIVIYFKEPSDGQVRAYQDAEVTQYPTYVTYNQNGQITPTYNPLPEPK